ncbi:MAG: LuxR family transcriptional regulator [Chloroflexi bacterium]|nr:LuxR family transcriptional regulator [Chloroflexota bacterium]
MGHLPPQPTVFVGREDEIAGAMEMLTDSHCRLLTLAGQGGIGKTRLALEIAARLLDYYPDGVHFVDLQAVYTADALIQVIADTLSCALSGHQPAFDQVLHFLRERDILLLLDNFEQLLPEQAEVLVGDLLNGCPKLTVLVTSREVLNVRQEWVWRVNGLAYPQEQPGDAVEDYDAIQLFVERARHIRHDFQLEADLPHILEICRLVEGMPLALELAAGWLKVLSCQAIAEEIRHNLDFLNSHQRDLPERHRSMRAVFEQGWKLLSPAERETMNRLSIFKGGFRREAAEQAAGANLATLLLLADKSLLRVDAGGRFHIHELVRQYAAEQLGDAAALLDAHCAHYAEFLHQRERDLSGGRQSEACSEIAEELDNIRAAWNHALNRDKFQTLLRMTTPYSLFCQFRGRYQEAHKTYHSATTYLARLEGIPDVDRALGTLLAGLGWMKIRLGQLSSAEIVFQQSEAAFRRLGLAPTGGYAMDPLIGQAVVALVRGEHGAAQHLAEQASQQADQSNSSASLRIACRTLAEAHLRQGNHERAHQYALRAYQLCEQADDRWFMAYCLTTLGEISIEVREYATARQHFERAYILRQEIHDPEGMALILAYLGDLALLQQAYGEALRCYHESRALYEQQVSDPGGLAKALAGLSRAYLSLGDYQAASETCRRGLQLAVSIEYIPVLLQLFNVAGELCYGAQRHEAGLEILALVAHHAMTNHASRSAVQHFLAQRRIAEPPPPAGHNLEHASALLQMAASAERYLLEIEQTQWLKIEGDGATGRDTNQALPDPLSQRELEVLGYIAAGLQNREIADRLFVSLNTVKTHINNIYSKLDVSNRVQAVARAQELELL